MLTVAARSSNVVLSAPQSHYLAPFNRFYSVSGALDLDGAAPTLNVTARFNKIPLIPPPDNQICCPASFRRTPALHVSALKPRRRRSYPDGGCSRCENAPSVIPEQPRLLADLRLSRSGRCRLCLKRTFTCVKFWLQPTRL